jgi:hypothetical protein
MLQSTDRNMVEFLASGRNPRRDKYTHLRKHDTLKTGSNNSQKSFPERKNADLILPVRPDLHRQLSHRHNGPITQEHTKSRAPLTSFLPWITDCCTLASGISNAVSPSILKVISAPEPRHRLRTGRTRTFEIELTPVPAFAAPYYFCELRSHILGVTLERRKRLRQMATYTEHGHTRC